MTIHKDHPSNRPETQSSEKFYRICVKGRLDAERATWFGDLGMTYEAETTILSGSIPDQPALFGVLLKIRDLGLELISVECLF